MGGYIYTAQAHYGTADAQEKKNDEDGEEETEEVAAAGKVVALPVDVLRSWRVVVGDHDGLVAEDGTFIRFVNAATAARAHASVRTVIE